MNFGQVLGGVGQGISGFTEGVSNGQDIAYKQQVMQLQQRRNELESYQALQSALKIPDKSMRGFVLNKLLPSAGMDPASDDGKNFIKAINGAEEETLKSVSDALEQAGLKGIPLKLLGQTIANDPGAAMKFVLGAADTRRQSEQMKDIFSDGMPAISTDPKEAIRSIQQLEVARNKALAYGNTDAATSIGQQQELIRKVSGLGRRPLGGTGGPKTLAFSYVDEDPKSPTFGQKIVKQIQKGEGTTVIGPARKADGELKDFATKISIRSAGQPTGDAEFDAKYPVDIAQQIYKKLKPLSLTTALGQGLDLSDMGGRGSAPPPGAANPDTGAPEIIPEQDNEAGSWAEQMLQQFQLDQDEE